ncbi:hypothetical protein ACM9VS_05550 [Legionella pneumophila]|uniref:hypothetical protein n=1 Tax=Legionella pneumophila TaxID=446 RepID=UPI003A4C686C
MITREQIYTMLMMNNRRDTLFSALPIELIKEISDYGQNPNSEIAIALNHAAYAQKEDVEALLALLDKNPRLLLQAGNVQTPGGDEVRRVTLYEFLLGAGDDELAGIVQGYFDKIDNGEQERIRQYERYKPHIEGMLTQKPYDLKSLIDLIKQASAEDVNALLNKDMTRKSALRDAIIQFRKDWAPRILTKPCMHYNYTSLQHAFDTLDCEWDNLYQASGNSYDKIRLVWRQLIGFEMRRLPGIDRCVMAQGLYGVTGSSESVARSYKFKNSDGGFPVLASDNSLEGLGGDFSVDIFGGRCGAGRGAEAVRGRVVELLCQTKTSNLQNLCSHSQLISRAGV